MGTDKYAYHSKIAHVKAEDKLAYTCSILLICLIFNSYAVSCATIFFMSLTTILLGGFRLKTYLKLLTIPMTFLLSGVITIVIQQFSSSNDTIYAIQLFGNFYGISLKSLKVGGGLFLKSLGAISCLYFFSLNTPLNSFLSVLRKRFSGILVELMELIYRYIFIIWDEANRIYVAQVSRLGYKGLVNSMNSLGELVITVFSRAFQRVERVYASLDSRGFEGSFDFLIEEEQSSKLLNSCTVILSIVLIIIGTIERFMR